MFNYKTDCFFQKFGYNFHDKCIPLMKKSCYIIHITRKRHDTLKTFHLSSKELRYFISG